MSQELRGSPSDRGLWSRAELVRAGLAVAVVLSCYGLLLLLDPQAFLRDDHQLQYLPAFYEAAQAWSEGELPLLSRSSWLGGALAGEYQYGVFSPFLTVVNQVVWKLTARPSTAANLFVLVHLAVLAAGAYYLARQLRLAFSLALMVAILASLNGWTVVWAAGLWVPALYSFAWLPWLWLSAEWAITAPGKTLRFLPAGLFLSLLLTAGWPFTVLMALLLFAWLAWCHWRLGKQPLALWPLPAAGLVGVGLAAPALLMLVEHVGSTMRSGGGLAAGFAWSVPPTALLGLVLPTYDSPWYIWSGWWERRPSLELAGGLVPLAALSTSLIARRRFGDRRLQAEMFLLLALGFLLMAPGLGSFKYSFRWLPFFHLLLALVGARVLAELAAPNLRAVGSRWPNLLRLPGFVALLLIFLSWTLLAVFGANSAKTTKLTLFLTVLAVIWALAERASASLKVFLPPVIAVASLIASLCCKAPSQITPTWRFTGDALAAEPFARDIRYLAFYRWQDLYRDGFTSGQDFRPGNVPMFSGLDFINGYSPTLPAGLSGHLGLRVHGDMAERIRRDSIRAWLEPGGLIDLMAVDGLLLPEALKLQVPVDGWRSAGRAGAAVVLQREKRPAARVRAVERASVDPEVSLFKGLHGRVQKRFAAARVQLVEEGRHHMEVEVEVEDPAREALIIFARPWFPGYRARFAGEPIAVEVADRIFPVVRVPAASRGLLRLEYRPLSLTIGLGVAAVTILSIALVASFAGTRRQRR